MARAVIALLATLDHAQGVSFESSLLRHSQLVDLSGDSLALSSASKETKIQHITCDTHNGVLKTVFKDEDTDGDGFMSEAELGQAFVWEPKEVGDKFREHDLDGDSKLSCDEWVKMMLNRARKEFNKLDGDGNGFLTVVEILDKHPGATKELVDQGVRVFDHNGDGKLTFDELVKMAMVMFNTLSGPMFKGKGMLPPGIGPPGMGPPGMGKGMVMPPPGKGKGMGKGGYGSGSGSAPGHGYGHGSGSGSGYGHPKYHCGSHGGILGNMFKHSDIDNDGFMTESEVRSASIWAPQQVHQKFVQHDADGNGKLTCQEMVNMVLDHGKIEFDQLDRDGNGFVTAVEILHSYPSVTKALVKAEIYKFDADGDDQLSFDEGVIMFLDWLANGPF